MQGEGDVAQAVSGEALDVEQGNARRAREMRVLFVQAAPDHQLYQPRFVAVGARHFGDKGAVAQHGDALADFK